MRKFFLAALFTSVIFFQSYAMEQQALITDSQELYDTAYYPISEDRLKKFIESTQRAHQTGTVDELCQLATDTHNPCIRSTMQLISHALQKQKFTQAALWCEYATLQAIFSGKRQHPAIALVFAGLLDSADDLKIDTPITKLHPLDRQHKIYEYLKCAALPHPLPANAENNSQFFVLPRAQQQLDAYEKTRFERIQAITDEHLQAFPADELKDFEELGTLPTACFFIQKYLHGNANTNTDFNPALAVHHAKSVFDSDNCKEYFKQSGVYELMQNYANVTKPNKEQISALLLLSEIEDDAKVALAHLKPVIKHLHRMPANDFPSLALETVTRIENVLRVPNTASLTLLYEFVESSGYKQYKKLLLNNSAWARDYAYQLIDFTQQQVFEDKAFAPRKEKIKSEALSLLHECAQTGDVRAYWKLLAHKELSESDAKLLAEAIEKTKSYHDPEPLNDIAQALANAEASDSVAMRCAVAQLYATGLGDCVAKDQAKALKYCALAGKDGVRQLIALESEINDPLVAFHAALHLHLNRTTYCIEKLSEARNAYLIKAQLHADEKLRKEIIIRCFSDGDLYYHGLNAISNLCEKYSKDLKFWTIEREFVNTLIDRLMALADGGDNRASTFLADILRAPETVVVHPNIPDCARAALHYTEQAAFRGDQKSLFALADHYEDLLGLPVKNAAYEKSAHYWSLIYMHAGTLTDEHEKKKWQELAASKTRALVKFHMLLVESKQMQDSQEFNYFCMMTLCNTNPMQAMECLYKAEQIQKQNEQEFYLINVLGVSSFIEKNVQLKKGWAYYAKAIIKLNRTAVDLSGTIESHKRNIESHKEILELLKNAAHAEQPFCNHEIVKESQLLHLLATQYRFIAQKSSALSEAEKKAYENALKYYDRASQKGCLKSTYACADVILSKKRAGNGQSMFEKAISYLIDAAEKKYEPAKNKLSTIYKEGFESVPLCGGGMTAELYDRIKKVMDVIEPDVFPELSRFDELLINTSKGIKCLQKREYERAYELFKDEADKGDLTAMVYLGIMHRDGLIVQCSQEKAYDYFIHALTHWLPSQNKYFSSLAPAHEALTEYAHTSLAARIARGLFIAGITMNVDDSLRNQVNPLLFEFTEAEKMACESTLEEDQYRIFTSGLAERINTILTVNAPMTFCVEVVSRYAQRIAKIGLPHSEEILTQLFEPSILLTQLLADVVETSNPINPFQGITEESLKALITNLKAAINASPKKASPNLQYLLGLVHVCAGMQGRPSASISSGMELIKNAAERNIARAMHTYGWLNVCYKSSKEFPMNRKNGIAMLEKLAKMDDLKGMITLARCYYAEKNDSKKISKKAVECLEAVLKKDPKNNEAAFLLAEIYSQHPSLIHHEYARAYNLFELSSSNMQLTASAHLYQLFLVLDKKYSIMETDQIVKKLLGVLQAATLHNDNVKMLINGLTVDYTFDVTLNKWLEAQIKILKDSKPSTLSQIYVAVAWWHLIMAKLRSDAKQPFDKDCVLAHEYLINAIKLPDCPIVAHCLQAAMHMQPSYQRIDLAEAKKNILLACSFLGKKGLKLKDEPLLQKTITEYKKEKTQNFVMQQGGGRNCTLILPEAECMKLSVDIDLIAKIEKQYS